MTNVRTKIEDGSPLARAKKKAKREQGVTSKTNALSEGSRCCRSRCTTWLPFVSRHRVTVASLRAFTTSSTCRKKNGETGRRSIKHVGYQISFFLFSSSNGNKVQRDVIHYARGSFRPCCNAEPTPRQSECLWAFSAVRNAKAEKNNTPNTISH